jgi:hypothetical protein
MASALLLWIVMAGLYRTGLLALSKWLLLVGAETFFVGGGLLLCLGVGLVLKAIVQQIRGYFSTYARLHRHLASDALRRNRRLRLFAGKVRQQFYFADLKRKRLLRADTLRQFQQLSGSLQRDLKRLHKRLPKLAYRQLQTQLKQGIRQQDLDSLLQLQRQIMAYGTHDDAGCETVGNSLF